MIIKYVSLLLIILGIVAILSASIGIIRSNNKYNKLHFLSLADGFGIIFFTIGILLSDFTFSLLFKLSFFIAIYLIGSTTSGYILGNLIYERKKQ